MLASNNFRSSVLASNQGARGSAAFAAGGVEARQAQRRSLDGQRRGSRRRSHTGGPLRFRPKNSTIREDGGTEEEDNLEAMLTATALALPGPRARSYGEFNS